MVSQRKRHVFIGLDLTVALVLAVSPATASAVSTLTGESFIGSSSSGNSGLCPSPTFSVSGTATGPYPGTFTESGIWTAPPFPPPPISHAKDTFSATFTITSGTTTISGSTRAIAPGGLFCGFGAHADFGFAGVPLSYTATIHTASGNFRDEGKAFVGVVISGSDSFYPPAGTAQLRENFFLSLTHPVLIGPTTKDQCKDGGWRNFPQFKNQGECVASVNHQ